MTDTAAPVPDASAEPPSADDPRIEVHGDQEGGFFVSIHDGDALRNFAVEVAKDAQDAKIQAIRRWRDLVAKAKALSAPVSSDLSNAAEALKTDLAQAASDLRSQLTSQLTQHHNSLASGLRSDAAMLWEQTKADFLALVDKAKAEYAALTGPGAAELGAAARAAGESPLVRVPRDTSIVGGDRGGSDTAQQSSS
ncbi:MAG: hypothetical protein KGL26_01055 [Pseudomonadota bacterium]|nr:hypothetical protein [Pseudomonadota bacterium]